MFALCIESSHEKGMGHLFRTLNLLSFLEEKQEKYIVLINDDEKALEIFKLKNIPYVIVNLKDYDTNWETKIIKNYAIDFWVNDRLDTDIRHAVNVLQNDTTIITFDDRGTGSELAEINFAGMTFDNSDTAGLKGKQIYYGIEYLILNNEIKKYRRVRTKLNKIMLTLGGSDTYGVTLQVLEILKELGKQADIYIGPSFKHLKELEKIAEGNYRIINTVPSLILEFFNYDLAITGGGITAFEANGSGLPCIIVANEIHEIKNARFLQKTGGSIFAGYYKDIDSEYFKQQIDINQMSKKGITGIPLNGVLNVYNKIKELSK